MTHKRAPARTPFGMALFAGVFSAGLALSGTAAAQAQTGTAAAPAPKPSTEILGTGFQRDSDQPVNVAADRLDVAQDAKTATFSGNVEIIQGELRLKAATVIVHYRSNDDEAATAAAPAAGNKAPGDKAPGDKGAAGKAPPAPAKPDGASKGASEISRLEAKTDVFLSSATQTAQGDWADYDVIKGEVTMGGKVVLTRAGNVLKGTALALDLNTGRSRLTAEPGAGGRVQGLFIPKKRDKATKP